MPFKFEKLEIEGLTLITPQIFEDKRGWFAEVFDSLVFFLEMDIQKVWMQDNQSYSKKNVLRGLHFQKNPNAQFKLVQCIKGEILDVAVDIDPKSPTFKKWKSVLLTEDNHSMLYLPESCAHGFLVLSDDAKIAYKCTARYNKESDAGIRWNDPDLNIDWGIDSPILSEKDQNLPFLKDIF